MDTHIRLRIATRIHFALMNRLGEGIDVGAMLKSDAEAREVLWVCEALGDAEITALARQYRQAGRLAAHGAKSAAGHAAHDAPWARDTSGFGLSRLPELPRQPSGSARKPAARATSGWMNPASWLRRGQHDPR